MIPILIVLGAGAVLEIKRLVSKPPGDGDLIRLRQSEERLKRVLQEVQRELQQEKREHQKDAQKAADLDRVAQELRMAQDDLTRKAAELHQRAEGLTTENEGLLQKVDELQAQHEEELRRESEKYEAQLEALKHQVADVFEEFSDGNLTAESLLERLHDLGVEVDLTAEDLRALPATSAENNSAKRVQHVELRVDTEWRSQLRLLSDDPERMARQLAEGAHRQALPAPGPSSAAFPTVRTPPKDRPEASIFSSVPSIAMAVFTPRVGAEKENMGRLTPVDPAKPAPRESSKEPLMPQPQSQAAMERSSSSSSIFYNASRKSATPTRKKPPTVPRLGLNVVLRGDPKGRSNRDAFALGDLSLDDGEFSHASAIMRK